MIGLRRVPPNLIDWSTSMSSPLEPSSSSSSNIDDAVGPPVILDLLLPPPLLGLPDDADDVVSLSSMATTHGSLP
nr:unnamed protein product [Digitaria exilis]